MGNGREYDDEVWVCSLLYMVPMMMSCRCRRRESNPHTRGYTILSRARLPIPPLRQYFYYTTMEHIF